MKQIEVVFCGNSVYLSGLAASLRPDPRLRVTQLDVPLAKALGDLRLIAPDAVVAEQPGEAAVKVLRQANPRFTFLLVDAVTDTLTVFGGGTLFEAPVADLARLVVDMPIDSATPSERRKDHA